MSKPILAIVGRPNVGKSTLFNKIIGKKIAVVGETPGLTRDRIYGEAVWEKKQFFVVDTGGFLPEATENIAKEVKKQALAAIEEADIILMLMDASSGLMPIDTALNNILRKHDKKVFYAVNKIDHQKKNLPCMNFIHWAKICTRSLRSADMGLTTSWIKFLKSCLRFRRRLLNIRRLQL